MRHASVLVALFLLLLGFNALLTDSRIDAAIQNTTMNPQIVVAQPQALVSFTTSQTLTPFTGTLTRTYAPKGFGLDLGAITYAFSQTQISWADGANNNMSFKIPKLSGTGLILSTSQNSSTIDYHLTGMILGHIVVIDMYLKQIKWNYKITIVGTISGLSGTLPLSITLPSSAVQQPNYPTGICISHLCFDWSDSSACTFVSSVFTCNVGPSFKIDPLAADNTAQNNCAAVTSCTTASVIEGLNDILIIACNSPVATSDTFSASSTPSLTWTKRKSVLAASVLTDEFYAISSASQSYTFTCSVSGAALIMQIREFGISGADTTTIFDNNAAVPCTASGTGTSPQTASCTLSTNNVNTFVFGIYGESNGLSAFTPASGFTAIGTLARPQAEYQIFSSVQTSLSVSATLASATSPFSWNEIGDAVFATQNTVTTTTSTTTTSTVTNNLGDPSPYLWLVLIPVIFVVFLLVRKAAR